MADVKRIEEPRKVIPVLFDVDVAVAGASVSGIFAAMSAARMGASVLLIDRFGSVGGNIGPGMITNGHMVSGSPHENLGYECTIYPKLYGIPKEFLDSRDTLEDAMRLYCAASALTLADRAR